MWVQVPPTAPFNMQKCKICNNPYGPPFLWVSDRLWEEIGMKKREHLCAYCLIDKLAEVGMAFYLVDGKRGQDLITPAAMRIDLKQNEPIMKALREDFYKTPHESS